MVNIDKIWGFEEIVVNNGLYCGKILHLRKNCQCSIHFHRKKNETFYVLDGMVHMEVDNEVYLMKAGHSIFVPRRTLHRFTGLMDSRIIEFSTPDEECDSYRFSTSACAVPVEG